MFILWKEAKEPYAFMLGIFANSSDTYERLIRICMLVMTLCPSQHFFCLFGDFPGLNQF